MPNVEAVKNSQQNLNAPFKLGGMPIGINAGLNDNSSRNGSTLEKYDMVASGLNRYGVMGFNQRVLGAYRREILQNANNYENYSVTQDDQANLKPLADRLGEYYVLGYRVHSGEIIDKTWQEAVQKGKGVELYLTKCAEDGLIDENGPVSFANLNNPLKAADVLITPLHVFTPQANENISLLTDIAINERSPEMAACLLEETSKSGLVGTDSDTARKLLIESRAAFNNKEEYSNFVTNIDKAYQKLFNKTLDEHIKDENKPIFQKVAPVAGVASGAAAGFFLGGFNPIGAILGAVAGGLAGGALYSLNWFGPSSEGKELLAAVDEARMNDNDINFGQGIGSGMGYGAGMGYGPGQGLGLGLGLGSRNLIRQY